MNTNDLPSSEAIAEVQTAAVGANFAAFAANPCAFCRVHNNTGVDIEVRIGASSTVYLTIPTASFRSLLGVRNLSDVAVRRVDQSNTQVTVEAEAFRA